MDKRTPSLILGFYFDLENFQSWFGVEFGFEENERRRAGNEEDESGGEGSHGQVAICS